MHPMVHLVIILRIWPALIQRITAAGHRIYDHNILLAIAMHGYSRDICRIGHGNGQKTDITSGGLNQSERKATTICSTGTGRGHIHIMRPGSHRSRTAHVRRGIEQCSVNRGGKEVFDIIVQVVHRPQWRSRKGRFGRGSTVEYLCVCWALQQHTAQQERITTYAGIAGFEGAGGYPAMGWVCHKHSV
ncbi:hypothetical protein D3C87_1533760 [compost metagenome]